MKRILALLFAALIAPFAFADVATTVTETQGTFDLYQGTKKISSQPTYAACLAQAKSLGLVTTFGCQNTIKITIAYVIPPKPAGVFQMLSCPAGSAPGAQWRQDADYVSAPAPTFWKLGTWLPKTAPKTACPVAPPVPMMHAGWAVDDKSVDFAVHLGSSDVLIDPPANFNCMTKADAVPGCVWPEPDGDNTGAFRNVAFAATMAYIDPIVHPGEDNTSHLHQFVGNTSINKDSTTASLLANCNSTFRGGAVSCSAVWAPVMVDTLDNTARKARVFIVYYKCGAWIDCAQLQPVPVGLQMVIGNPNALNYVRWGVTNFTCDGLQIAADADEPFVAGTHRIPTIEQCGPGHEVWMTAVAPNCWDGVHLYLPDGSHMAYPDSPWNSHTLTNGCQDHHPIAIPQVAVLAITTVGPNDNPTRWVLTSDKKQPLSAYVKGDLIMADGTIVKRGAGMHADYWGVIPLPFQQKFLDGCDRVHLDCQAHMMGDGHTMRGFGGN